MYPTRWGAGAERLIKFITVESRTVWLAHGNGTPFVTGRYAAQKPDTCQVRYPGVPHHIFPHALFGMIWLVHVLKSIPGPECKTIFQILSKADLTYRNVSVLPVTAEIHRRTMPAANPATDWSLAPSSPRGLRGCDILRSRARIRCSSPLVAGTTS
jgi:hypothetical protein